MVCVIYMVGTLGYVMSEVEDGKPLSQVVKSAKSLGYTEPGFVWFYLCNKSTQSQTSTPHLA